MESLLLLGVCEKNPISIIQNRINEFEDKRAFQKTRIIASSRIHPAKEITGEKIHVSLDIDVIKNITCLSRGDWSSDDGPSLEELAESFKGVVSKNHVVAVDIVGYQPKDLRDELIDTEGLRVYRTLLEQLY